MRFSYIHVLLFILLALQQFCTPALAQNASEASEKSIYLRESQEKILIDGLLSESTWQTADSVSDFMQNFPSDTAPALSRTVVRMAFDDEYLYIGAVCYDDLEGDYVVSSLKRDFSYPINDGFGVYLDPSSDKTNGFAFTLNPLGVQREGSLDNGGGFGVTTAWDNRWYSETHRGQGFWSAEMAIPFKTLRFNKGVDTWRVNFSRNDLKRNEGSTWVPVPRNFNIASLAFTGRMRFEHAPRKPGTNVSLIPYALAGYYADYQAGTERLLPNAGGDAKVAVTSALNLDLTVNPDFSQVEVDRQVTNLDRFSLFFPERRQFFIENSDLFGSFGFSRIRPFFSRQIGLYRGQQIPILAGARLSGKLTPGWRIGALNMQTRADSGLGVDPQNYTVLCFQRQVFARSNIAGIFVNRQGFNADRPDMADYNRLVGLDYNLASANNVWRGKFFVHYTFDPSGNRQRSANAAWLSRSTRRLNLMYNHEYVAQHYRAEVGFVPRTAYFRLEPSATLFFYPKKTQILSHGPDAYFSWYWDNRNWRSTDRQSRFLYKVSLRNRMELSAGVEDWYLYLQAPFDPTRSGLSPLPDSTGYAWRAARFNFTSDFRKRLSGNLSMDAGGYYNGNRYAAAGEISWRAQPWGIFSLAFEQNFFRFDSAQVNLSLISPRVELSFTRNLFFTTFFQFNTQTGNVNINARFQWRFKPMSDLFIVLTDNYATPGLAVRNRAIVLKLNYWFTL